MIVRFLRSNDDAIETIVVSKVCEDAEFQDLAIHSRRTVNILYRASDSKMTPLGLIHRCSGQFVWYPSRAAHQPAQRLPFPATAGPAAPIPECRPQPRPARPHHSAAAFPCVPSAAASGSFPPPAPGACDERRRKPP